MAGIDSSTISKTTVIRGNVRGEGSIRIDGEVRGNVEVTGDVELGDGAVVSGNISGARLIIAGNVEGDLSGSEAVLLESSATVTGDLRAPRIGIGEGAQVRGSIETHSGGAERRTPSTAMRPAMRRPEPRVEPARPAPKPEPAKPAPAKAKAPPPPVMHAPKKGARGRKKSRG